MDKILNRLENMPADFWLLLVAIPAFVIACILLLVAKKHRYKEFDKDGNLFEADRIAVGLDPSDANDGWLGGLDDGGNHH